MDKEAKATDLSELVKYQEGSVISREIINKPSGTVTLFAFDDGQGLSEHKAPFDALVCVIEGKAEVTVSGNKNTVAEGEFILMPANQPHSLKAVERFKMLLIMVG